LKDSATVPISLKASKLFKAPALDFNRIFLKSTKVFSSVAKSYETSISIGPS